jgi:hypothetical protein
MLFLKSSRVSGALPWPFVRPLLKRVGRLAQFI